MPDFQARGVIPPLVTPLTADGELMEQAMRDVVDHVIDGGVHGVFVLGSTGEIYGLDSNQKRRALEIVVEQTAGRVPVYCGASEITTRDCVATAHMAAEVGGVDALSVLTPYFLTPSQAELIEHFKTIAGETDLPVLLYNNPGKTKVSIATATVMTLAAIPNVIGVKDSSGDLTTLIDFVRNTPEDFAVLAGKDTLIHAAMAVGAQGAVASTANVAPRLVSGIYDAYVSGDEAKARELQGRLTPFRHLVDRATFPVVIKESLRIAGIDAGYCLAPAREVTEELRADLERIVPTITHS